MELTGTSTFAEVKSVVVTTLGIADRADTLTAVTPLLGSVPELDSMAVVELIAALEERFAISVEDDDVTADIFETLGTLTEFVDSKLR